MVEFNISVFTFRLLLSISIQVFTIWDLSVTFGFSK